MDSLFGEGTSLPVRFFIAFVVVFALIGVTAWLIRRFGTGALGGTGARGRAPRLAVIEAGAVDGRRKLVLIRRDNIEHLIMIGGPTDIVVEANIVRGQSTRDAATSRVSSVTENLARPAPAEETAWPLQPEVTPRQTRASRPASLDDAALWAMPPEPAAPPAAAAATAAPKRSRSADTLAGLAAELSVRPAEPVAAPAPAPRPAAPAIEIARPKPAPAPANAEADQNLADMASRLEAALRRPAPAPAAPVQRPAPAVKPAAEAPRAAPPVAPQKAPPVAPPIAPPVAPVAQQAVPVPAPATAPIVTIEPETHTADAKPGKADDVFGSIEEEMASLLGRPSGKPS
jgi:flagellar protein FliO/FliZ